MASPLAAGGTPTETDLKTFKDFLAQYNSLTERCFTDCVRDFTSRKLADKEDRCATNCLDKYLKMTQRISLRFQEYQMVQAESAGALPPTLPAK